ncbi:MAG TPA: DUF817 domain-containing protein [Dongiaceae bacterium]|nr:DUF817 domain-containing protein [Dongiaceae bacterium]
MAISKSAAARAAAELAMFGWKELLSCVFAGSFLLLLALSRHLTPPWLDRYDFLFLGALAIQAVLIALRLETAREVAVLSAFHALGMGLELFKTSPGVGSWSYPEPSIFHIATVPLYSGFMYAAVASYMMQAWRHLRLRLTGFPPQPVAIALCALIYGNFFSNHFMPDLRWPLALAVLVAFRRTRVHFTPLKDERQMPLVLSFALIGFFIWLAENVATYFGGWVYPNQLQAWAIVGPSKISSWALLVILSFIIVAALKREPGPSPAGLTRGSRAGGARSPDRVRA